MIQAEKFAAILEMLSINTLTRNEYPTISAFKVALREGRVVGEYGKRIVITSNDPRKSFTLWGTTNH